MVLLRRVVVFFTVMLMLLTGCNNQSIIDHARKDIDPEQNKYDLVIWHTYSEEETDVFENVVIPMFEKEHPNIDIKPVRQAYNEQLKSAIISRASAKKTPDIIRMDIAWLPSFAELGLLYPVSDFKDFNKVTSPLLRGPLKSNFYKDAYYGLPLNTNTKVAIYNREALKRAGFKTPPKTIDEWLYLIKDHKLEIGISGVSPWETLPYFYAFGGKLMNPNYTQASGYFDSEDSIKAVKELVYLYENKHLNQGILTGKADTWQGILNGKYAMIDEGPWFYSVHNPEELQNIKNQTIAAPFPSTNGKGSILGGESLVITKGAKQPEAAWSFIKWMTTETPQKLMFETGLIPTNKNVGLLGLYQKYPYYRPYVESINNTFLRPPVSEWSEIEQIYTRYLKLILSKNMTVEEGLKEATIKIDLLLEKKKGR
jgi:multiple sugar transport system substrate-binding protein